MTPDDNIKFAEHFKTAQNCLRDITINNMLQDQQYKEILNNLTEACLALQSMAIIMAREAIRKNFSDFSSNVRKDIQETIGKDT
jgi:ketosteroid isomerase-like protein